MSNVKGRNIKVEISQTLGVAKTVSGVTKASPGVATSTAHGFNNDDVGYFYSVSGMAQLEGQAWRAKNKTTDTWEIQGLDTTNYATFSAGSAKAVTAWQTLSEATGYSIGGGASEKLDVTRLIDITKQEEQGLLPAGTVSMNVIAQDTPSTAMALLAAAVQNQGTVIVRITLGNGAVRIFTGEPSLPGENVQSGAVGTGTIDFTVKGFVLSLAA